METRFACGGLIASAVAFALLRGIGVDDPASMFACVSVAWYVAGVAALRRARGRSR
jgi:hypothetical protein